ncbi:hypothetical protein WN51_12553 [Melipona quadrifasciata]|uniref:Uncharacterized protein n=1 Tax=Melipona quadrifasciata TaxID=166423 RepID=A0A0M9A266_9HYME|nr:hypothetical protein WN51_12553 [Melipona quadrifasciata]
MFRVFNDKFCVFNDKCDACIPKMYDSSKRQVEESWVVSPIRDQSAGSTNDYGARLITECDAKAVGAIIN